MEILTVAVIGTFIISS